MADLKRIRAREADPEAHAHRLRMIDAFNRRVDPKTQTALTDRAAKAASPRAKVILMRQAADNLIKAASGLSPCKKGCSHCCKMATLVSLEEAQLMAKETGTPLTMPSRFNAFEEYRRKYEAVPCTFLVNNACSIYAARPMACRLHIVLEIDNTVCEIVPGEKIIAPTINVHMYDKKFCEAFGDPAGMKFADIREWFPKGKR